MMITKMTYIYMLMMMTMKMTCIEYHLVFYALSGCPGGTAGCIGSAFE